MESILVGLKYASILVAGLFGMLALLVDYREKTTNKITRWGKIALIGVVTSALIGALSQAVEFQLSRQASIVRQQRYEESLHQFARLMLPLNPKRLELSLLLPTDAYSELDPGVVKISGKQIDASKLGRSISLKVYLIKPSPSSGDQLSTTDIENFSFSFLAMGEDSPGAGSIGVDSSGKSKMQWGYSIRENHVWSKGRNVLSIPDLPGTFMVLDMYIANNYTELPVEQVWSLLPLLHPESLFIRLENLQLQIPIKELSKLESKIYTTRYGFLFPSTLDAIFALNE